MKEALAENKGREEKGKIRDGEKAFIKGKKEKGGRNQSEIQTRSSSSTPATAVLPWEGKAAGWRCSAAPRWEQCCSLHPLQSRATPLHSNRSLRSQAEDRQAAENQNTTRIASSSLF